MSNFCFFLNLQRSKRFATLLLRYIKKSNRISCTRICTYENLLAAPTIHDIEFSCFKVTSSMRSTSVTVCTTDFTRDFPSSFVKKNVFRCEKLHFQYTVSKC